MDPPPERYGSYLVYEQLGKGGMATVHRAELRGKNGEVKQVALKRMVPTMQRELVEQFQSEGRLLRHLHHPNIAETYDSGRHFGTYFIAMEYVRGPTLKQLVEHVSKTVGVVPQPITLNLAGQLLDALDHAHNLRNDNGEPLHLIHRDVTPANIIISDTGLVKLIDFGLAKAKVLSEDTQQGVIKGKYSYIAPEYLGGNLDHRADLWAVGIILYELLTGRRLFDGHDAFETLKRVQQLPIPRPSLANPRVRPELDLLVMTALERNAEMRWQTATAMRDAIAAIAAQPGLGVDNDHVAQWVTWVLEQVPGAATNAAPHEGDAEPTTLDSMALPPPIDDDIDDDEPGEFRVPVLPAKMWLAGAITWALLVAIFLIWAAAS